MQSSVMIGEFEIPVWLEGSDVWYPLSIISRRFLGIEGLSIGGMPKWKEYINKFNIYINGANMNVNFMNYENTKRWISGKKSKHLSVENRKAYNVLCEYFSLPKIKEKEPIINFIPDDINYYNEYEKNMFDSIIDDNIKFALCNDCEIYYPINEKFYPKHPTANFGIATTRCKKCLSGGFSGEKDFDNKKEVFKNNKQTLLLENMLKVNCGKIYSIWYEDVNNIISLVNELKDDGIFTYKSLSNELYLETLSKYKINEKKLKIRYFEITMKIFGEDFYSKPYLYFRPYKFSEITFEFQKKVFNNYLNDNSIIIDDVFNFEYGKAIDDSRITIWLDDRSGGNSAKSRLEFVYKYYDCKYPAYKFKVNGINYYKDKGNRIRDLISFVEELDLDSLDKLPLYLTKNSLRNHSNTLYNILGNYYNNKLFAWVHECYPDKFCEKDFDIWYRRDDFDSVEEQRVHELLKDKFSKKLYYNAGDMSNRLTLNGCQPDWLVFDVKPIIIEYFGLYVDRNTDNKRISDYVNRTDEKIIKYDELINYDKIYIYPSDLKDNMKGLAEKLEVYV